MGGDVCGVVRSICLGVGRKTGGKEVDECGGTLRHVLIGNLFPISKSSMLHPRAIKYYFSPSVSCTPPLRSIPPILARHSF